MLVPRRVIDIFRHERRTETTPPSDCIAPTSTASATTNSGADYTSGTWTNENVTVTLSAQDNEGGSGVKDYNFAETDYDASGEPILFEYSGQDIRYSATGAQSIPETVYDPQEWLGIVTEGTTTISYYATDNMGNRESPAKTLVVKIDRTAPTANVTINDGDSYTNNSAVNLTLNAEPSSGSGVAEMRFSADGTTWSAWEPFATSKNWAVSEGDGEKTVYVQLKDAAGNESDTTNDTIALDKTPPRVSSTSPSNNATGVAATAKVSAKFSESASAMDPESLTTDTFNVVQVKATGNVPVSGTVSYSESTKTATFTPSRSLAKGAYRVTIATGVKDQTGNALAKPYTWQFATAGPR